MAQKVMTQKVSTKKENENAARLGVVLVRGFSRVTVPVKDTLRFLNLHHKNHCVFVKATPVTLGMLHKVKDYITWGEVSEEMLLEVVQKCGVEYKGNVTDSKGIYKYRFFVFSGKNYLPYFRLNPPRKGFGRKGTKVPFKLGGSLGYRGKAIDELLKRMMI